MPPPRPQRAQAEHGMTPDTLSLRVTRYLTRHIAFLESTLRALESIDFSGEEAISKFTKHAEVAAQLESEQAALLNEWQGGAGVPEEERAAVRVLAKRAAQLADQVRRAYDAANTQVAAAAASALLQANDVRRGADAARRFGLPGQDTGGFIDHSA